MMAKAHLLLLALLICSAHGAGLEDKKGPLDHKVLDVPEATPVPFAIFQFTSTVEGVSSYRVSGGTEGKISISSDGWLYLEEPLQWSPEKRHDLNIEALSADDNVLDGPYSVVLQVIDVNNNPPVFTQSQYSGSIREHSPAGMPFVQVLATDDDDANTPNAQLSYSIENQIPNPSGQFFFTINPNNGEISTTEEGAAFLRAKTGVIYSRGETRGSVDVLKKKFDEFCSPKTEVPLENNPFFTCVQHAESKRFNAIQDPDYTLIVRAVDLGGGAPSALSSTTRVNVAITQNLWVRPKPITIKENLLNEYPMLIASVRSNDPNALYRLVQNENEIHFPFTINEDGAIFVTEPLDREQKDRYILVVLAEDDQGVELETPMEIQVKVGDENDSPPVCAEAESIFEVQENEIVGSHIGDLLVLDADEENTLNSLLSYRLLSQNPANPSEGMFSIDEAQGKIQVAKHNFRRKDVPEYQLTIGVTDGVHSTECNVVIKIIDINNEIPIFEKNDYGTYSVPEVADVGTTLLTIKATDADDPGTGSSRVEYHISKGDPDKLFAIEVDDTTGEGRVYIAQPLDYEVQSIYQLQIDARNPEPLIEGVEYNEHSTTVVVIELVDVDEPPVFTVDILNINVPENLTVGTTLLTADAKDPDGQKIMFKLEGDEQGWFEVDPDSGELKTKAEMDREVVDQLKVRIIAYETDGQKQETEKEVSIQLLDVNDNFPKLQKTQGFMCVKNPTPLVLTAVDADAPPYGEPFTFALQMARKSPNWEITKVDGTSAKLVLKKKPAVDQTWSIPVNIKDNAGMGVTQKFEVRVCNCTELGYCYMEPKPHAWKLGVSTTIAILGGVLGFIILLLIIVICRIKKRDKKEEKVMADGETNAML
ncbi:cadherin-17 [Pygocentrus nattereri]|uniref:cadherin-17 n=1 Tax=Pygocentrus nattereri TaxID=42514 RepID=UPI001891272E|nr:cadherin-17 [Pygocentrus nattereri]